MDSIQHPLIGQTFGELTVLERVAVQHKHRARYSLRCVCSCGAERIVRDDNLRRGNTTSCGHTRNRSGEGNGNHRHGYAAHPHYGRYVTMWHRCNNPKDRAYKNYGARGIRVSDAFATVDLFCDWIDANLGPCPDGYTLDRIDVDGDYAPGNLRWADAVTQRNNQRGR